MNYKQIVLSTDQKEYKIRYSYKAAMLVKILCQLLAIQYLSDGYIWWLILEVVFAIIASVVLEHTIKRSYPWIITDLTKGKILSRKYPNILKKVKQLFFHKIGGFALTQTSPIIIYAYTTLTIVALYGNYMLVILGIQTLMAAIFNSMNAGIGNLVAEGNHERIFSVFEELFSVRFLFTSVMCFGIFMLTPSFITWWIGKEYVMDSITLLLMTAILFINLSRTTVDAYINAYGLFSDIWAPAAETSINIGMSVLLGYFFGLHGVLLGVLISLLLIIFCWKPYFLFRKGLRLPLIIYVVMYIKHLAVATFCTALIYSIFGQIVSFNPIDDMFSFLLYGGFIMIVYAVLLMLLLCLVGQGMRAFVRRIARMVR